LHVSDITYTHRVRCRFVPHVAHLHTHPYMQCVPRWLINSIRVRT